ncbi:putative inactive purple acid phosphatase 27 [Hordeum vulgare]|nr:putative inactive purple acid phosphatase 27 [Hordeum vulgare]
MPSSNRTNSDYSPFLNRMPVGDPASGQGYRDPGFIHTAFLKDLWPNREYSYQIGHELQDGTVAWGKAATFRASPYPGQASLQRVVIYGDMGLVRNFSSQANVMVKSGRE